VIGFAGVMALVLSEFVAGAAAFTWLTPLWRETKGTYFTIIESIISVFALLAWWAAGSGRVAGDVGTWSMVFALATLLATGLSAVLLLFRRPSAGRVLGSLSVPASVATLVAMASTSRSSYPVALFQLVAGAGFLGATFCGLFLGHWYLTDRKLTRRPIERITTIAIAASVLEMLAVASGGFSGTASTSTSLNPLLTAGALAPWIGLGSAFTTLVVCLLVKAALRGQRASAVQSATGFYYLAVVTAFTAEIAVKTRFLPD
jgi:hypothetical protein